MVSIIIPVYNVAAFLEQCIESCLNQAFSDIEIIAINDGSTDSSGVILDRFSILDPRLRVFHQDNQGVVCARSKGINESYGEWLMFVDGDDFITVDAVATLLKTVLEDNGDVAVGGFFIKRGRKVIQQSNNLPYGNGSKNIACALLAEKLQFSLSGKIFKRNLFEGIVVPNELKIGEDAYTVVQVLDKACKINVATSPVYYYVQRIESVMNSPSELAIQSRVFFVLLVSNYYKEKSYFKEVDFQIYYGRWIINEYFSFLRMGGKSINYDQQLILLINEKYLKTEKITSLLPSWRIYFLKAYKFSPLAGELFRSFFNNLRKIVRNIEN